jgi:hypothetical protein
MVAHASVRPGPIDPALIELRYVQNVLSYDGWLRYQGVPDLPITFRRPCSLPVLDLKRGDAPPQVFYRQAPSAAPPVRPGSLLRPLLARIDDTPHIDGVRLESGGGRLQAFHVRWTFMTYLGCTIRGRTDGPAPHFETLQRVPWRVTLTGRVVGGPAVAGVDGPGSSVDYDLPSEWHGRPGAMAAPTYNQCTGVETVE